MALPSVGRFLVLAVIGIGITAGLLVAGYYFFPDDPIPANQKGRTLIVPPPPPAPSPDQLRLVELGRQRTKILATHPAFSLKGHTDGVISVAFSPDGKLLASGSADQTIRLWDLSTHQEVATLRGHSAPVAVVRFSPDGKYLLSGSPDHTLLLWDVASRSIKTRFLDSSYIFNAVFLPDGKHFVSMGPFHLQTWQIDNEKPLPDRLEGTQFYSFDVSAAGEIAVGELEGMVLLWNPLTGKVIDRRQRHLIDPQGHTNQVLTLHYLKRGDLLIGDDNGIWLWDRHTGDVHHVRDGITNTLFPFDNDQFVATSLFDAGISSIDFSVGVGLFTRHTATDNQDPHEFATSPDDSLLAYAFGGSWKDDAGWSPPGVALGIEVYDIRALPELQKIDAESAQLNTKLSPPISRPVTSRPDPLPWK